MKYFIEYDLYFNFGEFSFIILLFEMDFKKFEENLNFFLI